jgi:hypothetical protein
LRSGALLHFGEQQAAHLLQAVLPPRNHPDHPWAPVAPLLLTEIAVRLTQAGLAQADLAQSIASSIYCYQRDREKPL